MKRIAAVAVFVLASMIAPSAFAQLNIYPPLTSVAVGNDTPGGQPIGTNDPSSDHLAQQFSLSSPTYISRIDLALSGGGLACTYSVAITKSLGPGGSYGSPLLQRSESEPPGTLGYFALSDSFPAILLPAGTYFLVLDASTGTSPCLINVQFPGSTASVAWRSVTLGSPEVGVVGSAFEETLDTSVWETTYDFGGTLPPFAFDLAGPVILPPTGGAAGQIARLIVQGPVIPAPGGPVEAQIGFLNAATGMPVAPLSSVTLNNGQAQSVDVPLTPLVARVGQHVDVLPVIAQLPGTAQGAPLQLSSTVQILDAVTGFGSLLSPAPQPGAPVPAFGPQILAGGQTLRVSVVAGTDPCVGQVAFNDLNGNPLGQATPLNLIPGTATSVDLNADTLSLKLGQRMEAQPALTVTAPASAVPLNSVCQASAEVFDHLTGRTWSYQSTMAALPAVQSPPAGAQ